VVDGGVLRLIWVAVAIIASEVVGIDTSLRGAGGP
jgi:hypothetical protein